MANITGMSCGRCHNLLREARAKGLVVCFCSCLDIEVRRKLNEILVGVQLYESEYTAV